METMRNDSVWDVRASKQAREGERKLRLNGFKFVKCWDCANGKLETL